jgi:hypothetical protein
MFKNFLNVRVSVKRLWQAADHPEKPVFTFLTASSVGEQKSPT